MAASDISFIETMLREFNVQAELYDILCWFRSFKLDVTKDIEKIYRQVLSQNQNIDREIVQMTQLNSCEDFK